MYLYPDLEDISLFADDSTAQHSSKCIHGQISHSSDAFGELTDQPHSGSEKNVRQFKDSKTLNVKQC